MSFRSVISAMFLVTLAVTGNSYGTSVTARDYFREGFVASTARQWDSAIELYSRSIELNPSDAEVYLQRAINLEMANRPDEAIADYERALQLQPHYYLALEYLAKLYETKGQYQNALDLYNRSLSLVTDPTWRSMVSWWIAETKKKMTLGDKRDINPLKGATSR